MSREMHMPTEIEPTSQCLQRIRREIHPHCVVCGSENLRGLHVCWTVLPDGGVEAVYVCPRGLEGYGHTVHGGMICSLLDGAMTNCLFAHGCVGMTAELKVRFRHPVIVEQPVVVRARIPTRSITCTTSRRSSNRTGGAWQPRGRSSWSSRTVGSDFAEVRLAVRPDLPH